jgi:putative glutamine amidotransferase
MTPRLPLIGIPVDVKLLENAPCHIVGEKYVNAIVHGADCYPVMLPAMSRGADLRAFGDKFPLSRIAGQLDGVFLPGSYSNVHPRRYGKSDRQPVLPIDEQRDEMALDLIHACIEQAVPLLAVCRGFQEMSVAFGGSIHVEVHQMDSFSDHRERYELPRDQQYQHAHPVEFTSDGLLHGIHGSTTAMVNSLHGQGIDRLGDGLVIEAAAPDGLIEAICVPDSPGFTLGVQWHPEWHFWEDELSRQIFHAFRDAAFARFQSR